MRIDPDEDVQIRAETVLQSYDCFQERHDWLSVVGTEVPEILQRRELLLDSGKVYQHDIVSGERLPLLLSGEETKTLEVRKRNERLQQVSRSEHQIRENLTELIAEWNDSRGDLRIVELLVNKIGNQFFIYTGASAPYTWIEDTLGFEGMMFALLESPSLVNTIMEGWLDATLKYAQAFKDSGGHGVRIEECLASADIISQAMYEKYAYPFEMRLFSELRRMGLKSILYFCGDVIPRIPSIRQLPIDALMVEESKKNFSIDISKIRTGIGPDICLLGNVDSFGMVQKGTENELAYEIARQYQVAGATGAFIHGVGSPLPLDLDPSRVDLFIRSAREAASTK